MIHVGQLGLDELDIDEILFNVLELNNDWIKRNDVPFYTLGRNAYMDGNTPEYFKESKILNPKLYKHFPLLYTATQIYLTNFLNQPVHLNHKFAYPSFHIFESNECFLNFPANWHYDFPNKTLGLGNENAFSFTVVIDIPESGAGLEYKDGEEYKYLKYNVGDIILHKGDFLHNIAPLKEYKPNEYRITLQGHIIRYEDRLIMYW